MAAKAENLTGQLSALALKRIGKERLKIEQDRKQLQECGIYTELADEVHRATAMIVGPKDTPYEHGFYFFDIQIPDNYPMQPPHVDFKTGDGRVRFNPNLYVEGKVCLSILGTWSGPPWTASSNLRSLLVSIQSLLNEHPIQNEPGHEKETGKDDKAYSEIIRYENIAVGVVRMLKNTPARMQAFRPKMRQVFLAHAEDYLKTLESYDDKDGTSARAPIWNFPVRYRPKDLRAELKELKETLTKEEAAAATSEEAEREEAQPSGAEGPAATESSSKRSAEASAQLEGTPQEKRQKL